jgi:ribonuclease P protein component
MRRSADFAAAVRGGRRGARPTLVLHVRSRPLEADPVRVGLVVSRKVGNAVVRNRVSRRLRAVCSARLDRWSAGDLVVIRALPASATATSAELGQDLDRALDRMREETAP